MIQQISSSEPIPVNTLLFYISSGTLIGMTGYEIAKEFFLPSISNGNPT